MNDNSYMIWLDVKRLGITKDDLMTLARENNIKKGEHIIKGINSVVKSWNQYAQKAQVNPGLTERIGSCLNTL